LAIDLLQSDVYSHYLTAPHHLRQDVERRLTLIPADEPLAVMIDEVQKLPRILDDVHSLYEAHKPRLRFVLTGSSARKLKAGGANLLAGRALTLHLHPLVHREAPLDLMRALQFGTLPAVYLDDPTPALTLKSYVQTYLKEEVLQEALVRRIDGFTRFLDLAGQYHGEPVNFSRIAKASHVSANTAQQYYQILVDTLVAFRLDAWTESIRKQLLAAPRFYFFDCGVLNALRGESGTELRPATFRYGKLFETFIILEHIRLNDYLETGFRFSYWRTNTGMEVDLIVQRSVMEPPLAIEIKSDLHPKRSDLGGLVSFHSENPDARLHCVCQTPRRYRIDSIEVWPWKEFMESLFVQQTLFSS
jgi:predicted AAA+ superfamily ATPase